MSEALSENEISGGVVHALPADLKRALTSDAKALETGEDITPLARNEPIYWISQQKGRKQELAGSNGAVPASKAESGDPVVGLAVHIVEIIAIRLNCSPSDVRFGSIADIGELVCDVRLVPQADMELLHPFRPIGLGSKK
jgi:hypothetical protein